MAMKVPSKGETVLVFDQFGSDERYDEYRREVLKSGGRLRRAVGVQSLLRHLQVYTPSFIVHLKDDSSA